MSNACAQPLRVLCVDDNTLVADALGRRLAQEPTIRWLGLVSEGTLVVPRTLELRPDVLLMDVDIPDVNTFAIVERLSREAPSVRVVMFSGHVNAGYIGRALDCGAWGYLSKHENGEVLIDCIKRVGRGEVVLSAEADAVHKRPNDPPSSAPPSSFPAA